MAWENVCYFLSQFSYISFGLSLRALCSLAFLFIWLYIEYRREMIFKLCGWPFCYCWLWTDIFVKYKWVNCQYLFLLFLFDYCRIIFYAPTHIILRSFSVLIVHFGPLLDLKVDLLAGNQNGVFSYFFFITLLILFLVVVMVDWWCLYIVLLQRSANNNA